MLRSQEALERRKDQVDATAICPRVVAATAVNPPPALLNWPPCSPASIGWLLLSYVPQLCAVQAHRHCPSSALGPPRIALARRPLSGDVHVEEGASAFRRGKRSRGVERNQPRIRACRELTNSPALPPPSPWLQNGNGEEEEHECWEGVL